MIKTARLLLIAIATIALLGVGLVDAQAQDDRQESPSAEPTPEPGQGPEKPATDEQPGDVATTKEAVAEDTAIFAEAMGIRPDEAAAALSYQVAFSENVSKLMAAGNVAWSEVDPLAQTGLVVFVGNAPDEALRTLGELDGVQIQDGARFSVDDQAWRANIVAQALRDSSDVAFNVAPGLDQINIDLPIGYEFDAERLLASVEAIATVTELPRQGGPVPPAFPGLSPGIVSESANVFDVSDFAVATSPEADLTIDTENAHGGEELTWYSGSSWLDCTSGFTVRNTSSLIRGVTTAGHCGSVDYIRDNQAALWHTTSQFAGYVGGFGDFGWYQTSGYEDSLFRASGPANYRSQQANPVWYAVGSYICFFGHVSYVTNGVNRTCNHKIEAHNTSNVSGTTGGLTRVSNRRSIDGDSGGGYSFNTGAIGSHVGSSATKQYYSPMGNVLWWYSLELAQ